MFSKDKTHLINDMFCNKHDTLFENNLLVTFVNKSFFSLLYIKRWITEIENNYLNLDV